MFAYIFTFNDITLAFTIFSLVGCAVFFALFPTYAAQVIDAISLKTVKTDKRLHVVGGVWVIAFIALLAVEVYCLVEFPKETLTASFWMTLVYMPFTKVVHNFIVDNILERVELIQLERFIAKNN